MTNTKLSEIELTHIDLLSEKYGGQALTCNDEFFAEANNLVKTSEPIFIEEKYTDRGKWMDGWETRRRRDKGYDWCTLRLGISGVFKAINVDTTHFKGNAPQEISIEVCFSESNPDENTLWEPLVQRSTVKADSHNFFMIQSEKPWTHIRLNIFPDGGVARLRVYGEPILDPKSLLPNEMIDLAANVNGGRAIACSDMFFSPMNNVIAPGKGVNMGDGWETKRRRGDGYDWLIVKLACPGKIARVVIDTCHFKGNFPDRFSLEAINSDDIGVTENSHDKWLEILPETKLFAHREHVFQNELVNINDCFTHIRLNIYPDGGVSRLRIWGFPEFN